MRMGDIVEFKVSKHKKMIKRKALEPIHPPASLVWFCPNKYCPEHRPFFLTNKLSKCPDCNQPINWENFQDKQ